MIVVKYGEVELPMLGNNLNYTKESNQVAFSDISCDFTNKTKDDLPDKYQEIQIVDTSLNEVLFYGYLDYYDLGEMRETDVDRTINMSIISPMSLATLRTVIIIGTYEISDLIRRIFQPLIDDGFEIVELNITSRNISVNYMVETIEYCINNLSNLFNIWWFIDEKKKIYIKEFNTVLSEEPNLIYDKNNMIEGLQYLKPTVSSGDYANVVNLKNVRLYEYSRLTFDKEEITKDVNKLLDEQITSLSKGEMLVLNNPIDINKNNIVKSAESNSVTGNGYYGIYCKGKFVDNSEFEFYVKYDILSGELILSENLDFDGNEASSTKDFLLVRDSFFSNLIIAVKYNGENEVDEIEELNSDSCLIYNVVKIYNDYAISQKEGIISNTGIIEITIDMNDQWKTIQEVQDIGISYIDKNSIEFDGTVEAKTDADVFKVGDIVKLNKMFFDGLYIVTSVKVMYSNNDYEYIVTLKNTNNSDNYLDLFRSQPKQQNSNVTPQLYITHYYKESISESHEVLQ